MHPPKLPRLEIGKRLMNLLLGVHHKWPMAHDRFIDRFATEQQHLGVVAGFQGELATITRE